MSRVVILFIFLIGGASASYGQTYPQGYFRNPLRIPILLAGNFGECRPNHFHSGLDIKTGGHENEPVYAAADGYVSRIKMEPGGFGHGLYITHPNGFTTLYAHLNDFAPTIQRYVRQQQYAKESWTVDLLFPATQFPVKKGQLIAWSGNTGGSTAPHLHFEIRDAKTEHPLNPQLFGFEVGDNIAPVLKRLVLYDMSNGIYNAPPKLYTLQKKGGEYVTGEEVITLSTDIIGVGIVADDYMQGSENTLALYTAEWYMDDGLQGRVRLDDIGYDETRYLHAYADYSLRKLQKLWSQCLFQLPGNRLDRIYESLNGMRGLLRPGDTNTHIVRIVISDVMGNSSELRFSLKATPKAAAGICLSPALPGRVDTYKTASMFFYVDESSLYDKACIEITEQKDAASLSPRVSIGKPTIPVHHSFELSLRPDKLIPFALRSKVAMIHTEGKEETGKAATPGLQGWFKASVRTLGEYRLMIDSTAPVIKPLTPIKGNLSRAKRIAIRATDELTSVKAFRGELDGKWILFEQHENVWTYVFDDHCPKGAHKLTIRVADENGNEAKASFTFTR
jgi:hypothetical protein